MTQMKNSVETFLQNAGKNYNKVKQKPYHVITAINTFCFQ